MPYIITTATAGTATMDGLSLPVPVSGMTAAERAAHSTKHAVATIDDAITVVADTLSRSPLWDDPTDEEQGAQYREFAAEVQAIDERGGTIGPLPDGTVIEVEPVTWGELSERAGTQHRNRYAISNTAILDAFNASRSDRYRADRFDDDGEPAKFYVFDTHDAGQECAGPFDTIGEAIAEQERLNGGYPHVIVTPAVDNPDGSRTPAKNAHGQYLGAPLQRWTIEMGNVPGLGDDCALDVYIPNTYEQETLLGLLIERGSEGGSGTHVDAVAPASLPPNQE